MNPEEEADKELFWVLNTIKRTLHLHTYGRVAVIKLDVKSLTDKDPDSPTRSDVVGIIVKLERGWKVLEIVEKYSESQKFGLDFDWENATKFVLEIYLKDFKKLYNQVEKNASLKRVKIVSDLPTKSELRNKIKDIIEVTKLGKKEVNLLKFLSMKFDTKTKTEICNETKSKAPIKLIASLRKKLIGTDFEIKTSKPKNLSQRTTYQLKYLPTQTSGHLQLASKKSS